MTTETYNQFLKRVEADKDAYNLIMRDYFTSNPDYDEKTDKVTRR
jgi:hypothetical protein